MAAQQPTPNWMRPLWVRILLVLIPAVWAGVEAVYGEQLWATLFGVAAAWGLWSLILKFDEGAPKA
jgi:hypothetical protein